MQKFRTTLINFVISAAIFVGLLICFELILRSGVINNPQYYQFSRSKKTSIANEKHRLLILGDSFIHPAGALSLELMQSMSKQRVSSLNSARAGYSPPKYLEKLKLHKNEFKPDIILLSYFVGNDITDVQYGFLGRKTSYLKELRRSVGSQFRESYLYQLVNEYRNRLAINSIAKQTAHPASEINPYLIQGAKSHPNYLLDNILMETEQNIKAWEYNREVIREIKKISNELKGKLIIVIFPRSIQIDDSKFKFYQEIGYNVDRRTLSSRKPQELMLRLCSELAIECVDLLPVFEELISSGKNIYLRNDDHLSAEGNLQAAKYISRALSDQLE